VEFSSHSKRSDSGVGSAAQRSSPANTLAYCVRNMSGNTDWRITCSISAWLGQMSRRKTERPPVPCPIGSL
jgi:hypothetical protein